MTLTQIDLKEIENIVEEKINEKTKNLPTKDEFFGQMSDVMGELAKIRGSQEVLTYKVMDDDICKAQVEDERNIKKVEIVIQDVR